MIGGRSGASDLARRIDTIETTYEFMLAYAGQGWPTEGEGNGARTHLQRAGRALDGLGEAVERVIADRASADVARSFAAVISEDSERAGASIALVLAHPAITSRLVDNLNASVHLRAVLSGLFLLDDWVRPRELASV